MALRLIPALHLATHSVAVYIDEAPDLRLSQPEAHILSQLASDGELTINQIHATFGHRRSTLTSILDRLVKRGLIARLVPEHDRRTVLIRLTTKGAVAAKNAYAKLSQLESRITKRVSPSAVAGFITVVNAFVEDAKASPKRARTKGSAEKRR